MAIISKNVPRDASQTPLPLVPSVTSLAVTNNASISSGTTVSFNVATTLIEVNALSQGIFMKWGTTPGVSTTVFDEYIQSGATRHYVVPVGTVAAQFLQQAASATLILIEK